jgi:hypothetical protein
VNRRRYRRHMKKLVVRLLGAVVVLNLVAVAAAMIARRRLPTYGDPDSSTFALVAAMDGVEFASRSAALQAGSGIAVVGGLEIDLTDARVVSPATLDLTAVLGGIDVVVPAEWRIEMASLVFLGGTNNLTDPDEVGDDAPVLVVDARAYMGGIAVRGQETRVAPE